ncbi:TPA: hypothetical protein DF272_03100 [Candidatus Falkowbacteria bacterium]|nr:hypothetical protein [Candidatus Falkowbacteria bacterium]
MKIVIINNLFKPYNIGGAEKIVELQATAWSSAHDVTIITTSPFKGISSLKLSADETETYAYKILRFFPLNLYHYLDGHDFFWFARLIWNFFDVFNLHSYLVIRQKLAEIKPDMVVFHNLKGIGYLLGLLSRKYRCVMILHDVQYAIPSGLLLKSEETKNSELNGLYCDINRHLFSGVQKVIAPSQWLLNFYRDKGLFSLAKTYKVPNPITGHGSFSGSRTLHQPLKLLFVGQIEDHKGLDWASNNLGSEIELDIVGSGSQLQNLRDKYPSKPSIRFHGRLDNPNLTQFYQQADYLLVPSRCYENYPTVILEAFAHGLPVIGVSHGGVPELVEEEKTGFLFESGVGDSLVKAVQKARSWADYESLRTACHQRVQPQSAENYEKTLLRIALE